MVFQQLQFDFDFPKTNTSYWKVNFDWEPQIGETCKIGSVIDYCETLQTTCYCYCMEVKVLEINKDFAKVETTERWALACGSSNYKGSPNFAGNIWTIKIENLAPIL